MLLTIQGELSNDLSCKNDRAFAQTILNIRVDFELLWTILRIKGIVTQIDKTPYLQLTEEMVDRFVYHLWFYGDRRLAFLHQRKVCSDLLRLCPARDRA